MSEIFNFERSPVEELRDMLPGTDGFDFGASPKIIVERVAEKRRQDPLYSPSLAELKAVDAVLIARAREAVGFDLGTSPHGLLPVSSEAEAVRGQPPFVQANKGECPSLQASSGLPAAQRRGEGRAMTGDVLPLSGEGLNAVVRPEIYTSPKVRSDSRCIREAAARQAREGAHYLRLNDREYLHLYAAVEHDRNRTSKAIRNGIADPQDLKATDSLWHILQAVMVRRMKGYRL